MKRIATTIAIAAVAIGASATAAGARCDCGDDDADVAIIGTTIAQDQQAQAPAPADQYSSYPQIDISIDQALAAAETIAQNAKTDFGSLDVAIATAVAAHEQHIALVPEATSV